MVWLTRPGRQPTVAGAGAAPTGPGPTHLWLVGGQLGSLGGKGQVGHTCVSLLDTSWDSTWMASCVPAPPCIPSCAALPLSPVKKQSSTTGSKFLAQGTLKPSPLSQPDCTTSMQVRAAVARGRKGRKGGGALLLLFPSHLTRLWLDGMGSMHMGLSPTFQAAHRVQLWLFPSHCRKSRARTSHWQKARRVV